MGLKQKILSPVVWGNLLGLAIATLLVILAVKKGLDIYTHHGEEIEIPNVIGKTPADALYVLEAEGLDCMVADSAFDRTLPAGIIIAQKPVQGSHVKQGRMVLLTVNSRTAPTMPLPDIAGNSSMREAQERLRQLGFKLGPVEYIDGDKDWVYGLLCNGRQVYNGDRVPVESTITLQVGRGTITETADDDVFLDEGNEPDDYYDYE